MTEENYYFEKKKVIDNTKYRIIAIYDEIGVDIKKNKELFISTAKNLVNQIIDKTLGYKNSITILDIKIDFASRFSSDPGNIVYIDIK